MNIDEKIGKIEQKIKEPSFLENKGLSNEVGYYIFDYDPKYELKVREEVSRLTNKYTNDSSYPFSIVEFDLYEIEKADTLTAREELLTLSGVGPKVADCILLFSTLKRFDVFPIDVWVRRVMNELYLKNPDETKVNKKEIEKIAFKKFGNLEGIAQQYLYYWKREA